MKAAPRACRSPGEEELSLHLRALKLPEPVREFPFCPDRRHRFDFCWPDRKLAVEVDGGVHRIKGRFLADVERHNLAQLLGWTVLRFTPGDVSAGKAVDAIEAVLGGDAGRALEIVQRK